jgi:transposase
MGRTALNGVTRVGVDLGKSQIQVHAVDADDKIVAARQVRRADFEEWCTKLPEGCIVAMEACSSAHHWGRLLTARGFEVRLISPSFVAPYRFAGTAGKSDANDAEAICEAASRPRMRFVPGRLCQATDIEHQQNPFDLGRIWRCATSKSRNIQSINACGSA